LKVGVVTDDGRTTSPHFGRARYYLVYDVEGGIIKGKETRPKSSPHHEMAGHEGGHHGFGEGHHQDPSEASKHASMLSNVGDCEAIVAHGMGWGIYEAMKQAGIKPFLTEATDADEAVRAYISGSLDDHPERLH